MITNGNYTDTYYDRDKFGNYKYDENDEIDTNTILSVIEKKNKEKFIPCKIFAQSGIIRETYTTNQGTWSLSKVTRTLNENEILPAIVVQRDDVVPVKATNETETDVTGYSNGYMLNQGIGSGAGYLESSNGEFKQK